jgi:uncharacterized peroxidase-related enzyme
MSFVSLVTEEQADEQVKQRYQEIRKKVGFLPNYYQAISRSLRLLDGQLLIGSAIMDDGVLPKTIKEQIGVMVSGLNTSSYCVAIHMEFLRQLGVEKAMARKLAIDYPSAAVGDKTQALLRFADKLTRRTEEIEEADIEAVRQAGWAEAEIFETVLTVAYFNFVNRVSIGLGLVADF